MSSELSGAADANCEPGVADQPVASIGVASMRPGQRSPHLRADCTNCCGLCCVAPSFEAHQGFGFSKPAHTPCMHLLADFGCLIHEQLQARGFPGCHAFDCYGAGQRVTQGLFRGESWRASAEVATRMFHAYHRYRALHELLAMLELAIESSLPADATQLRMRFQSLESMCDSGAAVHAGFSLEVLRREVLQQVREALGRAQRVA